MDEMKLGLRTGKRHSQNYRMEHRRVKMKPRVSRGHSSLGTPGQAAADARKKTHRGTPQG